MAEDFAVNQGKFSQASISCNDPIEGSCTIILHRRSMRLLQNPDGWQENLTKSGGKRAAKTHSTAVNTGSKACLKNIRHTEMPKGGIPWASLIIPAQKMLRRLSPGGLTRPDRPCAPGRLPSAPRRCRRGRSAPSPARRPGRLRSGPPGRSAPPAIWWCRRRGAP